MAQISMFCWPSFVAVFPAKTASPFSGVFLYVLSSLIIVSRPSMTAERVCLDLMLVAVDRSDSSCFWTRLMFCPVGINTETSWVCRPLMPSRISTVSSSSWACWGVRSDMVLMGRWWL